MFICSIFIHEYEHFRSVLTDFVRIEITQHLKSFCCFLFHNLDVDFHGFESFKYGVYNCSNILFIKQIMLHFFQINSWFCFQKILQFITHNINQNTIMIEWNCWKCDMSFINIDVIFDFFNNTFRNIFNISNDKNKRADC